MKKTYRRWGGITVLVTAAALVLSACAGGSNSPRVASLSTTASVGTSRSTGGGSVTIPPTAGNPTRLLDKWAACMRAHGDPSQADPTIDSSKVIHLTWNNLPGGIYGTNQGGQGNAGPGQYCRTYIDTAETDLQGAQDQQQPSQVQSVKFSQCMRATGVPDFPDPSPDGTLHFSVGGDLNPSNPVFQNASDLCAKKNGVPGLAGGGSPSRALSSLTATARAVPVAEFSARRVAAIAAIAGALVGGAVAGGVAVASTGGTQTSSSPDGNASLTTAAVVRTTISTSVQVGGSIGYEGSYTIGTPSGASAQEVDQDQLVVTKDQQSLSADEQSETDAATSDNQLSAADQTNVTADQSILSADQATQVQDCAGSGASTSACNSDAQKVSQDGTQLNQADQQLAAAQATATLDRDQNQAKVVSDKTALAGDQATLTLAQASAQNPGTTYTALPSVGDVIKEDQSVYSLSDEPVPLLYGSIAAYRAFFVGMSDGADVGELTQDLIALGDGVGLSQSNHYSSATATAVERWQSALGLPVTGEILLGAVVFEPGPIRVTSVTPSVGSVVGGSGSAGAGGGAVLTATSTTPVVTLDLDVSQEYLVKEGDAVSIVLPDGTSSVGGHIETVGNVATCAGGGGTGSGTGAAVGGSAATQSTCSSGGSGSDATPTVPVTVTLDSTPELATLDQAPVNVDITTQRAPNVLAVPVNALLALQGGGYGVEVVRGTTSHLVGVSTGLYSSTNSLVQVSGSGINVGTRVQVPSS